MRKVIDLKEYVVKIHYEEKTSGLIVEVFDAGGELIDYIEVSDDDESDDFNLN